MRQATGTVTCACSLAITRSSGRALEPIRLDVPAGVAQDRVARGREAGEVRHLAAGDEADAAVGRQAQQLAHPCRDATSSATESDGEAEYPPPF